ncbi:hypothetical protein [Hydrogenimonas sp. SS33]|uniref:translation initiation factor eIF-2B n=1 Tax=Hydrogenimonas leucolamina TaxID=2954236 RepID=UPI00336BF907
MTPSEWRDLLDAIERDALHGATWLTEKGAALLLSMLQKDAPAEELETAAVSLARARPMMASLFNLANGFLWAWSRNKDMAAAFVRDYLAGLRGEGSAAAQKAASILREGDTLLTHSASSLVEKALLQAHAEGKGFRVYCTESRPKCEGMSLAKRLCEAGIDATLIVDAAAGEVARRCDKILIGSDGIGSFGLVHKMGTMPLSCLAKSGGVPLYAVATSQKVWPAAFAKPVEKEKDPKDLGVEGCFDVENRYFDITPPEWLGRFLTAEGEMTWEGVLKRYGREAIHPLLISG